VKDAFGSAYAEASRVVNGQFPRLSWNLWSGRRTLQQASIAEVGPALRNRWERHAGVPRRPTAGTSLLLIVPTADHIDIPWEPALGNYSFELYETACASLGADRVHTVRISRETPAPEWHASVVALARDLGVTHVLGRIDIEPNAAPDWSWDVFVRQLRRAWPGIFLPLTYDSAYPYLSMHLDRITRLDSRAMPIVLDRPITPVIRPHRPAAGPLFLPLSDASTHAINAAIVDAEADLDLTFIGNVTGYPYRAALLDDLGRAGLTVDVNPQRSEHEGVPGFTAYARALRRSRVTLNFTRCNGVPVTQLKTRVLEGSLFGSVVACDSPLYARDYFTEGVEFISYTSPRDLRAQLEVLFAEPDRLEAMRAQALTRAESLRVRSFWQQTDAALARRGLDRLPLVSVPPA
jgi:hypothetical protein